MAERLPIAIRALIITMAKHIKQWFVGDINRYVAPGQWGENTKRN